ncbi:Lsr2 family protein [Tessaracoccus sp. OS52]|uniref:histone-like nucleoid-structuring protein Lsr2 n=1 Tax=Tessaracoccus sp. OS52 TaxID=2886691 RepID=UPI001D12AA65|nr:Lsr2 family protein [Tessaracoccus sp. OS52]MCC2591820.1 Lsr2 family protein [Tessaracoccus sp. OS52]
MEGEVNMARRTVIAYYSDLSGVEISGSTEVSVQFSLDGTDYEIDLAPDEQSALREALAPFVSSAQKEVGAAPQRRRAAEGNQADNEPSSRLLRDWARENGFDVPSRGRVPELVRDAYKAALSHGEVRSIKRLLEPVSNRT